MLLLKSALALSLPFASLAAVLSTSSPPSQHPAKSSFRPLPALRHQDELERRWVQQAEGFVPEILKK
jgi:hypothetical protein